MDINVTGTWNMATEAMQRMSTQEDTETSGTVAGSVRNVGQGSIVNVGSGASLRGVAGLASYAASKHAVLGLTRSWARDFPKLRVNLVAPGELLRPFNHITHLTLIPSKERQKHLWQNPLLPVRRRMIPVWSLEKHRLLRYRKEEWPTQRMLRMPLSFSCRIGRASSQDSACLSTVATSEVRSHLS